MNRMRKIIGTCMMAVTPFLLWTEPATAKVVTATQTLRISMQQRIPSNPKEGAWIVAGRTENWNPVETAIIVCDMWDKHWCDDATARVAEMAPAMNETLAAARKKGVKIVHAPSECMDYYAAYPGRREALKYKDRKIAALADGSKLPSEETALWPVDQSDEGCENAGCKPHKAWSKQIDALIVEDHDLISDSGAEIGAWFKKKGIRNVILMGVHTNMCVIGRSLGLRAMKRMGMNVVLMRDMTDLMYNHERAPFVDHFSGLDLMEEYIETYVCPTIASTDITGRKPFCFKGDRRRRAAFLTAGGEKRANQRLAEFARELTLKNIHCDFALGNLENLRILEDADLAVFFICRRALGPEKMQAVRNYAASGGAILGLCTAALHAFDAKGNKENASDLPAQWPEFDEQVLGGNYQGHYGHLDTGTDISIVPGMENHPLLRGVLPFNSPNRLCRNRPLRSGKAQVLLLGSNPGVPDEPVMWTNGKNVIYTSLGQWEDWKIESFRNLMFNTFYYLLKLEK